MSQSIDSYDLIIGGITSNKSLSVLRTKFGDSYEERVLDGKNNEQESYSLVWVPMSKSDAAALETILQTSISSKANLIAWTAPDSTTEKKWYAENINKNNLSSTLWQVSATLIRDYTL